MNRDVSKALAEASGLLISPWRTLQLTRKLCSDAWRLTFEQHHLYSYTTTRRDTAEALNLLLHWILNAQRPDGGIAAYYSLLTGYSESYPEVTGYIIPTLYDVAKTEFARTPNAINDGEVVTAAECAMQWLLSLQMPDGAFPAGLHGAEARASIFNTGQILQGLVRAHAETHRAEGLQAVLAAGDWLIRMQQPDGSWSGSGAYQNSSHTYYSMVAWALAQLSTQSGDHRYAIAAEKNLDWVLSHFQPSGWIDGINLRGHPNYLHFIAYVLQGVLECGILRHRSDAIEAVAKSAWVLLRNFEVNKFMCGAYASDFKNGQRFTCLTGNAQMSCVWLRLYEHTDDLRYLNAALKINEMLKEFLPSRGAQGIVGGVTGSFPVWGPYQPLRYISWGCKFLADALLLEQKLTRAFETATLEALPCAS
ncbi:MAG: prenyltransferase/squalene oxidase repeat-containing protein [Candidatus Sulfotelmatobacter sp.]